MRRPRRRPFTTALFCLTEADAYQSPSLGDGGRARAGGLLNINFHDFVFCSSELHARRSCCYCSLCNCDVLDKCLFWFIMKTKDWQIRLLFRKREGKNVLQYTLLIVLLDGVSIGDGNRSKLYFMRNTLVCMLSPQCQIQSGSSIHDGNVLLHKTQRLCSASNFFLCV